VVDVDDIEAEARDAGQQVPDVSANVEPDARAHLMHRRHEPPLVRKDEGFVSFADTWLATASPMPTVSAPAATCALAKSIAVSTQRAISALA